MTMNNTPQTKRPRRPRLQRTVDSMLEGKASTAMVHTQVSGQCAEGWLTLQDAGKPLGLGPTEIFGLLMQHSYAPVLKALRRAQAERKADKNHASLAEK